LHYIKNHLKRIKITEKPRIYDELLIKLQVKFELILICNKAVMDN